MTNDERRIRAAGEKLAKQLGAVFTVDAGKLRDYRARVRPAPPRKDIAE